MVPIPTTIDEIQHLAEINMSSQHGQFVRRGSYGNWTRDRNREKLNQLALNPRLLRDTTKRDLSTTVLGSKIEFPIMCAPAGAQCASHPDGELATVRAAGGIGTLMALPVGSGHTIESVGQAASGPIWFQHIHYSNAVSEILLPKLKNSGFSAVILTVDCIGPFELTENLHTHESRGRMFGSLEGHDEILDEHGLARWIPPNLTWDRLEWIRSLSGDLPLVIKGIRTVEDALKCLEYPVEGIVVSNHGGRQFDGGRSSIEILPEIADAVGDKLEIYFDSGVRSGLDAFRAIALGARAVFVGRPVHWGLAYSGEEGVLLAMQILKAEFDKVLAYSGCTRIDQVTKEFIHTAHFNQF
tara:strand:+ start:4432 stop:5496 length:1065 start_codon:yes stop_codon:yes gene_type:complete